MDEIEVKFLNIDISRITSRLTEIGAKKVFSKLYKRRVFDYPDLRLSEAAAWLRLRDEGDKVTLTFKQRKGVKEDITENDDGMTEIEVEVNDFDTTAQILTAAGLQEKFYEENKRTRFILDSITFDIDEWPSLPPYLEIESDSWDNISKGIALLGLNAKDQRITSTHQLYKLVGINENEYSEITFDRMVKK